MRIKILSTILISIPLLAACDIGRELAESVIDVVKNPQTEIGEQVLGSHSSKLKNLEFTCVKEQFPSLPQEADQLYRYALYHDLHNRKRPSQRKNVLDYLHYYRIAAANGHWRANLTLQKHLAANDAIEVENSLNEGIAYNLLLEDTLPPPTCGGAATSWRATIPATRRAIPPPICAAPPNAAMPKRSI